MHGGVTALISAGELHLPGLPLPPDARTALSVAIVTKKCYDNLRPSGVKVYAGTLLLVPGSTEKDFDEIAVAGDQAGQVYFLRLQPAAQRRSGALRAIGRMRAASK